MTLHPLPPPLSLLQARLWSIQQQQDGRVYYTSGIIALEGMLDVKAFQRAVQYMVNRHEILRTTFRPLPGMDVPMQIVMDEVDQVCQVESLENLDEASQQAQLEAVFKAVRAGIGDLTRSPLLISLLKLSPEKHALLISLPALCADATTLQLFVDELGRIYAACLQGTEFDEETLQYIDISAWQNNLLEAEEAEQWRAYWHDIDLSGLDQTPLPFTRSQLLPREHQEAAPAVQNYCWKLADEESQRLQQAAQQMQVGMEAWLLACWHLVLARLTEAEDLVLGVGCDGRHYEELSNVPGLHSRYVPASLHYNEQRPFSQHVLYIEHVLQEERELQEYFCWPPVEAAGSAAGDLPAHKFPLSYFYERWPGEVRAGGCAGACCSVIGNWSQQDSSSGYCTWVMSCN